MYLTHWNNGVMEIQQLKLMLIDPLDRSCVTSFGIDETTKTSDARMSCCYYRAAAPAALKRQQCRLDAPTSL